MCFLSKNNGGSIVQTNQELNAKIAQKIEVAPGLIILRIVPDGWTLAEFEAGQFAVIGLPGASPRYLYSESEGTVPDPDKMIRRAYSIASSSVNKEFIEFYITLVGSGALTPRIFALQQGDPIYLSPKITGMFTMSKVPEDKNLVLISTGTGLAPYMSMLRSALPGDGKRRFSVIHGARHSWELGYRSELITIERICPNVDYFTIISRPDSEKIKWGGFTGYVQDIWTRGHLAETWGYDPTPDNTHVFLCGNPKMIDDVCVILGRDGFKEHTKKEPGEIHFERYW
ncbi:MAG: ferredoxin--NADP reductase [Candidatus Marinimicrobia bacterium CG_4_9_14_3_um_filter_48_9]|nr:MAG: ferredoxin--NADP reductase [Candidatus Marinimicrobia bacterium CG_4_9_14_3_um_filter_48_9]